VSPPGWGVGFGEATTYVLASGLRGTPSPDPSRKREGSS
jgi:hypothetical protein